jgi:hypothetical protein
VRALGYTAPITRNEKLVGWELPSIQPLCFVGADKVAVTLTVPRSAESLPRRGDIGSLPLLLKGLFLDANSGKLSATLEWPTATNRARISPVIGTGFAVLTPDVLMLYSSGLKLLRELPLSLGRKARPISFTPYASPSGRYLIIAYDPVKGEYGLSLWVDLRNLTVLKNWVSNAAYLTISDAGQSINYDATPGLGFGIGSPGEVTTNSPCASTDQDCRSLFIFNATFVDDNTLFATRPPNRVRRFSIVLMKTDGTRVFDQQLPDAEVIRPFYPVVGGGRFAIAVYKGHGGSAFLDTAPHFTLKEIRIYDSQTGQMVYTLDGKSQKIKSISAFALSPDGSLLALIDQDGVLRLYRLS